MTRDDVLAVQARCRSNTMFACCPTPGTDKTGEMKQLAEGCGACIKRCPAPLGRGLVQLADGRHEARLAVRDQRARRVAQRVAVPGARAAAVSQGFASMPLGGRRSPVPKLPLGPRRAGSRRPDNKACRQCCYAARTTGMSAKRPHVASKLVGSAQRPS